MWDRNMIIATVSALIGVIMAWVSMLQATPLTLRYAATVITLVSSIVFLVAFLSLGTPVRR